MAHPPPRSTQPPVTEYGTTELSQGDERVPGLRRRSLMRWGITALVVAAALALAGYGYSRHGGSATSTSTGSAPSTMVADGGAAIQCWQSSYVDGEAQMMEPISGLKWTSTETKTASSFITVDASTTFQEMYGFGGAFTEAAALQFAKLSKKKQEEVLKLYFDKEEGSAYEFGRVPMGSSDFAVASYNYDNVTGDKELTHFDTTVEQDAKVIIPFIKRALEKNPGLKLFLSPWSPPAWMKRADPATNYVPSMLSSAKPNGLRDDMRQAWALYFSKFITAYKAHGLDFWGLTPQNEPEFAAPWDACAYNASYEADFVGEYLGPLMAHDHPDVKIMVYDHNRGSVLEWAETLFTHPTASQYVDGIAVHWYNDDERVLDGVQMHDQVNDTHFVDDSRFIMATESCNCPGVANGTDAWFRAQRYAHDILTNINNWVVGWVDWNLILDHTGGPNHLGNNCDAPIIIDESEQDYYIQPMYYFIQHFSKFVPPGSRRIATNVAVQYEQPGDAQLFPRFPVALHTCDGSSRQVIEKTEDSKLQIKETPFCIDLVAPDSARPQVELVECQYTAQQWTFEEDKISMAGQCLQLNHGSSADGVALTVGACVDGAHQKWSIQDGVMQAQASADKCVTAGYSFLQSVSFVTPEKKAITVVLNENTEDASFALQYGDLSVETTIPAGAIQTFLWDA